MRRTCSIRWLPVWIILCALLQALPAAARSRAKTDVIVLDNGDRITCEIKQLERGVLTIKTEYVKDSFDVEWVHVKEVASSQLFEVELASGERYYGGLATEPNGDAMIVKGEGATATVKYHEVVGIDTLEQSFWGNVHGSLQAGIAAQKANAQQSYNLAASADYRTRVYEYRTSVSSYVSSSDNAATSQRNSFTFYLKREYGGTWYGGTGAKVDNNNELDLDLRTTLFTGAGRYIAQSNEMQLGWLAGLAGDREWYAEEPEPTSNLEALLQLQYQLFLFGRRDTSVSVELDVLPGLSSWGRVRSNLDTTIQYELIKDFYWNVNVVADYDSRPPEGNAGFDWNLSASLAYNF